MNGVPNKPGLWDRIVKSFAASHQISDITQIAELLGLSYQSVYKWKSGLLPSVDTLLKIADLTNSSTQWLLTGDGPRKFKGLKDQLTVPAPQFVSVKDQLAAKPEPQFQSALKLIEGSSDVAGFTSAEKKVIQDIAAAGGISFEETVVHLVREALAMKGIGAMPDFMPVPVFQMMNDDELFRRLDTLPEQEKKAETQRLIGALMMKSVGQP